MDNHIVNKLPRQLHEIDVENNITSLITAAPSAFEFLTDISRCEKAKCFAIGLESLW